MAPLQAVDLVLPPGEEASTSNSGCEPEDFADFIEGNIALVQRGTCDFSVKAHNAFEAGAIGVIIFNEGQEGRTETLAATLSDTFSDDLPVIGTSFEIGNDLAALLTDGEVIIHLATETLIELDVPTQNLIAETPTGRDDRVVMAGATSTPSRPVLASMTTVRARGRCWSSRCRSRTSVSSRATRSASPGGVPKSRPGRLAGLRRQPDQVRGEGRRAVPDFDMIASPNYARFVYDGDGSAFGIKGPTGSGAIEEVFEEYFTSQDLASEPTAFDGRSDYDAFITAGIPAGGLFTGAEDNKTTAQVALYGGFRRSTRRSWPTTRATTRRATASTRSGRCRCRSVRSSERRL